MTPPAIAILRAYYDSGDASDLGPSASTVLTAICLEWDKLWCKTPVSWRIEYLCSISGLTINTVRKATSALAAAGWISIESGIHRKKAARYKPQKPLRLADFDAKVQSNFDAKNEPNLTETSQNTDTNVGPYIPIPKPKPKPKKAAPVVDEGFEEFWNLYDHKLSRKSAAKAWSKLNDTEKSLAINSVSAYVASTKTGNDPSDRRTSRAHAASWLNAERWTDEIPDSEMPHDGRLLPDSSYEGITHSKAENAAWLNAGEERERLA